MSKIGIAHPEAEEAMAALTYALEDSELSSDDLDTCCLLLAQVCEIAGLERPEQLEDL